MTRSEHLAWCKNRALEYIQMGDLTNAVVSMLSDLGKHPETINHPGADLGSRLCFSGNMKSADDVRNFIEGFN